MSEQRPGLLSRVRAVGVGVIFVVLGAVLVILHALGWAETGDVHLFELGVGIAFLGIAIG